MFEQEKRVINFLFNQTNTTLEIFGTEGITSASYNGDTRRATHGECRERRWRKRGASASRHLIR